MDGRWIELLVVVVIVAFAPAFLENRKPNLLGHLLALGHPMLVPEINKTKFLITKFKIIVMSLLESEIVMAE